MWPGTALDLPAVVVHDIKVHDGVWIELLEDGRSVDLPPDAYLREWSAVSAPSDALGFVAAWGAARDVDSRDLPGGETAREMVIEPAAEAAGLLPDNADGITGGRHKLGERLGLDVIERRWRIVHVSEVTFRADLMRRLAQHVTALQAGADDEDSWRPFAEIVNPALSAFQVSVSLDGARAPGLPQITAYSVAALQLANDLALETPYRECGNERCPHGRIFTRQRGRSHYGQHRTTGIKYCSDTCARAQGQRELRRRRKKDAR